MFTIAVMATVTRTSLLGEREAGPRLSQRITAGSGGVDFGDAAGKKESLRTNSLVAVRSQPVVLRAANFIIPTEA
jgi:hypothetical protein